MMEKLLIDALKLTSDKNMQALLIESYIQEYGAISNENGEIIRQIIAKRGESE